MMVIISNIKEPEINLENCYKHRHMMTFKPSFWNQSKDIIIDELRAHYKRCEQIIALMDTHKQLTTLEMTLAQYSYRFIDIAKEGI
jgi:hypothetical protein